MEPPRWGAADHGTPFFIWREMPEAFPAGQADRRLAARERKAWLLLAKSGPVKGREVLSGALAGREGAEQESRMGGRFGVACSVGREGAEEARAGAEGGWFGRGAPGAGVLWDLEGVRP